MNFTRRFLSVLLAVVMVFSMLPPTHVHGVEAPRQSASTLEKMNGEKQSLVLPKPEAPAQQGEEMSIPLRVNPLYKDVLRLEDAALRHDRPAPQADYSTQAVMSNAEAAQVIRDGMNRRESDIPVTFVSDTSDYEQAYNEMFELAIAHTGKPKEGDTLKWQWSFTYAYNFRW